MPRNRSQTHFTGQGDPLSRKTFLSLALSILALHMPSRLAANKAEQSLYDVSISGGRVIDPETGLDAIRNIAIRQGRIAEITDRPLKARRQIDATLMIVAPGFIDLHAHGQHLQGQRLQAQDGVTTAIDMENGAYPVEPFYRERAGKALINYGIAASHICVRVAVKTASECPQLNFLGPVAGAPGDALGMPDRTPFLDAASDADINAIIAGLKRGLEQGALGFGIGLEYEPGVGRSEVFRIFRWAGQHKVPVFVHVRRRTPDGASGVAIAVVQEILANAAATGAPLQLVHVTSTGQNDTAVILELLRDAREHGVDVTTEAYPYTAGSTVLGSALFEKGWNESLGLDYSDIQWPETGERLNQDTFEAYRRDKPEATVIVHMIDERVIQVAIADPMVSIASDGMPWRTAKEHPRGSGSFARVLGHYVRERGIIDWMTAIRKMTLMPALRMQGFAPTMAAKGRLQVGADADITIFDPKTIADQATFESPMRPSTGIRHVLVGGTEIVTDGKIVEGRAPGLPIRGRMAK